MRKSTCSFKSFFKAAIILGTALLQHNLLSAQVLINENFSGASGTTPPAGWSNMDNGGTAPTMIWEFNNPAPRTITGGNPGFAGQFAILDSDNYGFGNDQDAILESPAFDASTGGTYRLEFDNNWEECCNATGTVEVWDGSAWTTVMTMPVTNNGDGAEDPSTHETIDITAATGASTAAKVRFRYIGSYDYWWALDNITVTRLTCTSPAATFDVVPDCANSQFSVTVNLTSMGSATSVSIQEGSTVYATATAAGTYSAGPFADQSTHTLTLAHNTDALCNVTSDPLISICADNCSWAIDISDGSTHSGDNTGATVSTFPPAASNNCSSPFGSGANDVWYKVTAGSNGQLTVTQEVPDSTDLTLEVLSGDCSNLTEISCDASSYSIGVNTVEFTATAGTTYYIRTYGWSGTEEGPFSIQASGTPLPVTMTLLEASLIPGNIARLQWATLDEQNNKGFDIQRAADGRNFHTVGYVGSQAENGHSSRKLEYTFTDKDAVKGDVYYRLQQVDRDGKTTLSNTVRLSVKEGSAFSITAVPNPVTDKLVLNITGTQGDHAMLTVSDVTGKVVKTAVVSSNATVIDMAGLSRGMYLIRYVDGLHNESIKVSKQ